MAGTATDIDDDSDSQLPERGTLVTVRDSIQMARLAQRMGLIDELTVEEVMTEIDARL